jgi:hypothetical protein
MPRYSGVTSNLDQARKQHQGDKRNMRKWLLANSGKPFASREAAVTWLKTQAGEHDPRAAPAPDTTQDSLPDGGQPCPGRGSHPPGSAPKSTDTTKAARASVVPRSFCR